MYVYLILEKKNWRYQHIVRIPTQKQEDAKKKNKQKTTFENSHTVYVALLLFRCVHYYGATEKQMHGLRQKVICLIPSCSPYSISWSHTAWDKKTRIKSGNDRDWKVHGCIAKRQYGLQQSTTPKMLLLGLTAKHLLSDSCSQRQLNTKLLLTSKLT